MLDVRSLHEDPLLRERIIRDYVKRSLDGPAAEAFEAHYLLCDECFAELRASDLIVAAFRHSVISRREHEDVVVIEFSGPAQLVRDSSLARQLQGILHQGDSRVLIDLSQVSRIDSAGLGMLMGCYSHLLRRRGMLKILRPSPAVQRVFAVTRLDGVVETFDDESQALSSFSS